MIGVVCRTGFWIVGLLVTVRALGAGFVDESALVDRVVELMDRRLALMPEVAAVKFADRKPVYDPARETAVIARSVADARALCLDGDAARTFFETQIAMARAVQEACLSRWRTSRDEPPKPRDLVTRIRPELDALGSELLSSVYVASSGVVSISEGELRKRLARLSGHAGVDDVVIADLARSLGALRLTAAPGWDAIRRAGVLRIGTTGDYAPYSEENRGALRGLDIDRAESLGRAWGLRVIFVRTSWPTLMDDLARHRFDVGASGITITEERRRSADFSAPYAVDGKIPIARANDAAGYSSLEKIDRPGVRVIVNPGGTNEKFVREHIHRATILAHPDNRTIFDEILAGRADVMITDGIEARLQERRHRGLKATMAEPLTRAEKGFLLPPDSDLTQRVNVWLEQQAKATKRNDAVEG